MREIKFRAWWTRGKIMYLPLIPFGQKESMMKRTGIPWHTELEESFVYMQYTGLKDKNDKEIYEGDIVKLGVIPTEEEPEGEEHKAEIIFSKGQFWTTHYGFPVHSWACNDKCFIEVIGNIHEKPELLKS